MFKPFGYSVDLPNNELRVFDTAAYRLSTTDVPRDGAVVRWVREAAVIDRLSGSATAGWRYSIPVPR
jgi:hypothetical protein